MTGRRCAVVAQAGFCFSVILVVVFCSGVIACAASGEETETEKHNQDAGASDDSGAKELRRGEIDRTNRELKIIQAAILEGLKGKGVVPPSDMGLIPSGTFIMGLDETDIPGLKPAHRVYLDAYWIDQFLVTNAAYRVCVEAHVCRPPMDRPGGFLNRKAYHDNPEFDKFPVNYVRHEHAVVYCQWAEKRLPSEAEWEKAARGDDGRLYPWGDEVPERFRETDSKFLSVPQVYPVGSMPEFASPYGVMDMGGSMWEWVADSYSGDYYANGSVVNPKGPQAHMTKVKRGGDHFILTPWAVVRSPEWTRDSNPNVGFRCAKDLTIP